MTLKTEGRAYLKAVFILQKMNQGSIGVYHLPSLKFPASINVVHTGQVLRAEFRIEKADLD